MRGINYKILLTVLFTLPFLCGEWVSSAETSSIERWWSLVEEANAKEDYINALDYLRRIEDINPYNPEVSRAKVILLNNLGNKYYRERDLSRARDVFLEAIQIEPDNFITLRMLGEIAYFSQHMDDAERYWNEALLLHPEDHTLNNLISKLKKENDIERNLESTSLANFDIRYHNSDPTYNIYNIQGALLEAYQEIGYDFNYYPVRSIVVLLYRGDEFAKIRNTPNWVGAIYDGKIRLPIMDDKLDETDIKSILWHEYTHALINDATNNNCPRWLHEGLAQYEQAKIIPIDMSPLDFAVRHDIIIPLSQLDQSFEFTQSGDKARLAYAQAYSLTEYILAKYGFWKLNVIFQELKRGRDWKIVLEEELLMPISELEDEWEASI